MKDKYPEFLRNLEGAILVGYRGSIAHGMYVPNTNPFSIDDKDIMGIVIPSIDCYFGLKSFGHRGTKEKFEGEWDIVIYEIKKYINLLKKSNPNVLSLLWLEENHYIQRLPEGNILIENRDMFVSKAIYKSFTGYAYGQLQRMEKFKFDGYMGEKRKALVERFGYDTKNAAHLIRLLRMGIEFLIDGELYVYRKDAPQLLEIKHGKWSLKKVKKEAEKLFSLAEEAYIKSNLPAKTDDEKINNLCKILITRYYKRKGIL